MYQKNHLVVFSLNKKVEFFSGNPKLEQMHLISQPDAQHQEMKSNTAAIFQVADELYMNRKFRQTKATNTPGP